MQTFNRFRLLHAALAVSFVVAWLTGEGEGDLHRWPGYAVLALTVVRLTLLPLVSGFPRLWPDWRRLSLAAAVSRALTLALFAVLLATAASGIAMQLTASGDKPASPQASLTPAAHDEGAEDDSEHEADARGDEEDGEHEGESWLEEAHEVLAHLGLLLVGGHLAWLLAVRRDALLLMLAGRRPAGRQS